MIHCRSIVAETIPSIKIMAKTVRNLQFLFKLQIREYQKHLKITNGNSTHNVTNGSEQMRVNGGKEFWRNDRKNGTSERERESWRHKIESGGSMRWRESWVSSESERVESVLLSLRLKRMMTQLVNFRSIYYAFVSLLYLSFWIICVLWYSRLSMSTPTLYKHCMTSWLESMNEDNSIFPSH